MVLQQQPPQAKQQGQEERRKKEREYERVLEVGVGLAGEKVLDGAFVFFQKGRVKR